MSKTHDAADEVAESNVRAYELMLILNPELLDSKAKKKLKELEEFIEKEGGKITHADAWGKRKLAYRIGQFAEGNYSVYTLQMPVTLVKEVNEHLRIDVDVIRHMVVSVPDDYKYETYGEEEEKKMPEKPKTAAHGKPVRKITRDEAEGIVNAPAKEETAAKKEEEKEAVSEEAIISPKKTASDKKVDEDALDKKLDQILNDADLNL